MLQQERELIALYQFAFKMETEAFRGLGCAGVPRGTSKQNRPKCNEGIRLKGNWYYMSKITKAFQPSSACFRLKRCRVTAFTSVKSPCLPASGVSP